MTNRRQFIQAGSALLTAAAAPLRAWSAESTANIYAAVYDDRFAEGLAFGGQARRRGLRARPISGDVTTLWYDDLYHRWKQGPATIAGLTTVESLFCLETLGRDAGLRLMQKTEHRIGPAQHHVLLSWLLAPAVRA